MPRRPASRWPRARSTISAPRSRRWRASSSRPPTSTNASRPTARSPRATLTFALAQLIKDQVWGQGFPEPRFAGRFSVEAQKVVGEKHLRLTLGLDGQRFAAIRFGSADPLPDSVHAVYRLDVNEFQGSATLQPSSYRVDGNRDRPPFRPELPAE
jgi:hypothetical protein